MMKLTSTFMVLGSSCPPSTAQQASDLQVRCTHQYPPRRAKGTPHLPILCNLGHAPPVYPDYTPTVLACDGSSGDLPNPVTLDDCWTIDPLDATPEWVADDNLPNGPQVMSDDIMLADRTIPFINGARKDSGGGHQADDPIYNG